MTAWFYHVTCFTNVLKSLRCYHSFLVEIIVKSVNLIQMSKYKIIITMVENNEKNIYQNTEQKALYYKKLHSRERQMTFNRKIVGLNES